MKVIKYIVFILSTSFLMPQTITNVDSLNQFAQDRSNQYIFDKQFALEFAVKNNISSFYEYSDGTTTLLSQSTIGWMSDNYINDSSHDILIHPASYGNYDGSSSDRSLPDIVIPSMQTYLDSESSISIDYVVQSISDVKESDEEGLKYYLIPLSD